MINTRELIKKHNFTIRKKYGQNFLIDQNILEGIACAADVSKDDIVLEIGPGLGALTQILCERAKHVIAVEIDKMLMPILEEALHDYDNLTLVNQDILKTDIPDLVRRSVHKNNTNTDNNGWAEESSIKGSKKFKIKVVANLPYYITTPIVMKLLEKENIIKSITVMIQKEVAERMQEGPGSKTYGALSLAVQYYSKPHVAMTVSKNCFVPKPDVDSAVIVLDIYDPEERPVKVSDQDKMFRIIRAAFNQRRKTLVNALSNSGDISYSKEHILKAIEELGKPPAVRGEVLTLEEFAYLSETL